jgi:hypothetical protein
MRPEMTPEPSESTVTQLEIISRPADTSVKPSQVLSASSETHKDLGVPRTDPVYRFIDLQISSIEKDISGVSKRSKTAKQTARGDRF